MQDLVDDYAITLSLDDDWGLEFSDILLSYHTGVVVIAVAQL